MSNDGPRLQRLLPDSLRELIGDLHREFAPHWTELAGRRLARQRAFRAGGLPEFLTETANVREAAWHVAPVPAELRDRRVEMIAPANSAVDLAAARRSGAPIVVADFDDLFAPTWQNVVEGHSNLAGWTSTSGPVLMVRPRGWHLHETNVTVDGAPVLAPIFDTALYLAQPGASPYLYLPKVESHQEARLWGMLLERLEGYLGLQPGTVRVTVQIEAITAAFEMDEILFALRDRALGLNAGRWDYLFNLIKRLGHRQEFILPDRDQVTMTVPFMAAYAAELVRVTRRRGAQAIGGTAGLIPDGANRREVHEWVRADKEREASLGYEGAWAVHPDLVPAVMEAFTKQAGVCGPSSDELLPSGLVSGTVTEGGLRRNITAALAYLSAFVRGTGSVVRSGVVEDMATAEVSRAQLWQWLHHGVRLVDGRPVTPHLYRQCCTDEAARVQADPVALEILDRLVLADPMPEYLATVASACFR